jgi:preprotein translocase subunit SecG
METVIIVIHLMVIVALVAVVMLQRSDGGALGIGGSSGFMTTRGQGNVLTRSTAILAAAFFATSIALTILARMSGGGGSILESAPLQGQPGSSGGILNQLEPLGTPPASTTPAPGASTAPATTAPATTPAPAPATPAPTTPSVPSSQ